MLAILFGILITVTKSQTSSPSVQTTSPSKAPSTPTTPPVDYSSLDFETCVSDKSFVASIAVELRRNKEYNIMQIKITGVESAWFSAGFGSKSMQQTYAIVVSDAGIQEYILGEHSAYIDGQNTNPEDMVMEDAELLTENTWVITPDVDIEDGIKTVIITRPYDTPLTYDFSNFMNKKVNTLDVISAYGTANTFMYHGIDNRGFGTVSTTCTAFTPSPTTVPIVTNLTASSVLDPKYNLDISVNIIGDLVTITMNGPSNIWYSVGFGGSSMNGTYAIIVRDVIEERTLSFHSNGSIISSSITVQNDTTDVINSIRTVVLTRARVGDATHYSFPSSVGNIPIIYGYGRSLAFNSMAFGQAGTLSFMQVGGTNVPTLPPTKSLKTPSPTHAISDHCDVYVDKAMRTASGVWIAVCIDLMGNLVDIYMSGPVDRWYGIGFGNTVMKNTYSIVADDTVEEYKLGNHHSCGNKLAPTISILNDTIIAGIRHVHVSRSLTADYFVFPNNTETIDIIWGTGSQLTYIGSSMDEKGVDTLSFVHTGRTWPPTSAITPSPTQTLSPTSDPTIMSTGDNECTDSLTASQNVGGDGFDLIIGFTIDCMDNTISMNVDYDAFSPNWFGIVFGDRMSPDNDGYNTALVFTTGKSGDRAVEFYTYHITGTNIQSVVWQPELNWTRMNQVIDGNTVSIEYKTALSNTQWTTSTETIIFRYAYGSDMTLARHISTSDVFKYDMQTGGMTIEKDDISPYTCHGVMMWIIWSVLASFGIMSSRFRRIIKKCAPRRNALWFLIHRTVQQSVVVFVIIAFSIVVYYTGHNGNEHFDSPHKKIGLTVFVVAIFQPLNALIRPHASVNGKSKPLKRFLWEIIHKGLGYSIWIMGLVNCYLGLCTDIINSKKWSIVHCIWIIIIGVIFICLWIYDYWLVGKANESDAIGVGLLDNDVVKLKRKTHKASLSNSMELRRNSVSNDKEMLNNETDNEQYQLLENEQL